MSRRYVDTPPEFFYPDVWRSRPEGSVKQGSGTDVVAELKTARFIHAGDGLVKEANVDLRYAALIRAAENLYQDMLDSGIAPEQARMVLPQSMFTSYYVTGSLAAFARAYKQRIDSHAQVEIQLLAQQWGALIQPLFPVSWDALVNG